MRLQKNYRAIIISLVSIFIALIIVSCAIKPTHAATGESKGESLMVGVPVDRCPVFYIDPNTKEIVGIGVDLMRAAAENAGYDVTFLRIEEATLKEALDNEAYDLVMPFGSAVSSASGQPSIVSENLIMTPFTLVTAGDQNLPPINELKVGMLSSLGAGAETVKQLYPGIEIILYDTMPACVKALRAGEVDALLHNSYVWSYVLQKPSYTDLTVLPSAMFSMDFRAGTLDTPEGQKIIARLNEGIAELADTRKQAIILDYTSRRLYQYDLSDYLHEYGLVVLLVVLLFISLIVIAFQRIRSIRKEQEEKMIWLTDHDALTGVLSLEGFRKRTEELLHTYPDTPYLLVYTNIKNFKFINNSLGKASGDELLRFWADKTKENLTDKEAIGRISADHFVVLRHAEGDEKVRFDSKKVIDAVRSYFIDQGKGRRVRVCGGIYVLTPEDYRNPDVDRMLDMARVAEKKVQDTHKDGYEFYNPEQWEKGKRSADIISHLPVAIQNGEIQVWYQPQVDYRTGQVTGAEALCRWNHAKLGWIGPAEFIPVLEESSLVFDIDCFVWDKVCQDLQRWNRQGMNRFISVNLSRCDIIADRDIPKHFHDLIKTYGLTADQLRIEITETAYVEKPELLIRITKELRELGFLVEMDDFGSGYSSLHMLKEVPVDRIKLDLYFFTETGDQNRGKTIIRHMIQMAQSLDMEIIAEGVEKIEQAEFLNENGCHEMQGFCFYKPMTVQEFDRIIR